MKEDLNPPAIIKQVSALDDLIAQAKAINAEITTTRRLDLEQTLALGKVLFKAKSMCRHGEWLPCVEKMGIDRRRAAEATGALHGFKQLANGDDTLFPTLRLSIVKAIVEMQRVGTWLLPSKMQGRLEQYDAAVSAAGATASGN
jgi:hypothetical protein